MAEPTQEELLRETYRLARENNRMLHGMRRRAFLAGLVHFLIWAAVLGLSFWSFATYVYPILNSSMKALNQMQGSVQQAQGAGSAAGQQIDSLLNQFKKIPGFGNLGQ